MGGKKKNKLGRTAFQVQAGYGEKGVPIGNALCEETDRGCALTAQEFLSDALERYLRVQMTKMGADEEDVEEFVTKFTAPLGSFSARVKAARWFNLIGPKTFAVLECIRRVRNRFAHCAGRVDFTDAIVEPDVRAIAEFVVERHNRFFPEKKITEALLGRKGLAEFSAQRQAFIAAVAAVWITLRTCAAGLERDDEPADDGAYGRW